MINPTTNDQVLLDAILTELKKINANIILLNGGGGGNGNGGRDAAIYITVSDNPLYNGKILNINSDVTGDYYLSEEGVDQLIFSRDEKGGYRWALVSKPEFPLGFNLAGIEGAYSPAGGEKTSMRVLLQGSEEAAESK